MSTAPEQRTVRYCYECGHKVDPSRESCWYCGTQTRRMVRPPRHCQFCGSEIPFGALKCRHCGEWVDGRPQERHAPQQVVFVVDRQLLGSMQDMQLLAGNKVPPAVAARLTPRTVQAIESGKPAMIEGPGVRALPAPEAVGNEENIIEVPAESRDLVISANRPPDTKESKALQRRDAQLAPYEADPGAGKSLMARLGGALMKSSPAYRRTQKDEPAGPDALDADAGDLYRVCEKCGAEILRSDNYCYHCGMRYHKSAIELHIERRRSLSANLTPFLIIVVLMFMMVAIQFVPLPPLPAPITAAWIPLGIGGCAILLSAIAFIRHPGILSRIISIALIAATIYLYLKF